MDMSKMDVVYKRPSSLVDTVTHYCPGCGHGIVHRMVAEIIDELQIENNTVGIAPVGCSVFAYNYLDIDMQQAAHGRACAVASALKRLMPDNYVFTYQGDGDLAGIGGNETLHACNRGEDITIIFINNAIYGMTGGQMAPTTLIGQKASTCPTGRDAKTMGEPIRMAELLAQLNGTCYVERTSIHNPANVRKTKAALLKAFKNQKDKKGTSVIEILSNCPSNWKMSAPDANKWIETNMVPYFPLGVYKDR